MSIEFEKIVLEKFDELNSKISGLSEEIHELKEKVDNNTNSIINLSSKFDSLEEKVNRNTNSINTLAKNIDINTDLIATISKQIEKQGLNFAQFEHEFTIKVQALFDSFVSNTEEHLFFNKAISALNLENFHQSSKIANLENLFNNAKVLKAN